MTPAARILTAALLHCFALIAEESQGRVPGLPLVKGRWAAMQRAWAACPEAERVYAEAKAAWLAETGRCAVGGEPAPCSCHLPARADSGAAA